MARVLSGNDLEKLHELCSFKYKEQAVWFLNAFWEEFGEQQAENVWKFAHKFSDLDEAKRGEGNGLDEFFAHRFLETFNETLTVQAMRDKLRSVGAIGQTERPKVVPLVHYLIWKFNIDWKYMINAPQGSKEEVEEAERLLREVQAAFAECQARDKEAAEALQEAREREAEAIEREEEAKQREAEARQREAEAKQREAEARAREAEAVQSEAEAKQRESEAVQREEELRAAKEELEAALAEVKAQEDAYNSKTAELTHLSESGTSMVAKNRAKNELAQHLGEDPLPLRRAKITAEAAVKKADRAAQAAAVAREQAEAAADEASRTRADAQAAANQASKARANAEDAANQASRARAEAEDALRRSEQAKVAAEEALDEAQRRLEEAEAYLEEVKKRLPLGSVWWLERELHEARAYLPASKGGYAKKKVL